MRKKTPFFLCAALLLAAATVQTVHAGAGRGFAPAQVKYKSVQKIFGANCVGCHGAHPRGEIDLRTYESVMKGGEDGPVVKAKDADHSVLYRAITGSARRTSHASEGTACR